MPKPEYFLNKDLILFEKPIEWKIVVQKKTLRKTFFFLFVYWINKKFKLSGTIIGIRMRYYSQKSMYPKI